MHLLPPCVPFSHHLLCFIFNTCDAAHIKKKKLPEERSDSAHRFLSSLASFSFSCIPDSLLHEVPHSPLCQPTTMMEILFRSIQPFRDDSHFPFFSLPIPSFWDFFACLQRFDYLSFCAFSLLFAAGLSAQECYFESQSCVSRASSPPHQHYLAPVNDSTPPFSTSTCDRHQVRTIHDLDMFLELFDDCCFPTSHPLVFHAKIIAFFQLSAFSLLYSFE